METVLLGERIDVDLLFPGGDVSTEKSLLEKRPDHFKSTGFYVIEDVTSFEKKSRAEMVTRGVDIRQRPYSGVEQTFSEDTGAATTHTADHDEILCLRHGMRF